MGHVLIALAIALATLSVIDGLFATLGGFTLLLGPAVGGALAWLAEKQGASRLSSRLAIGLNAVVLGLTVIAIFLLGGT